MLDCARDAEVTGIDLAANVTTVQFYANGVLFIDHQLKALDNHIDEVANQLPEFILLKSIPGSGAILASLILREIGDINRQAFHVITPDERVRLYQNNRKKAV